MDKEVQLKENIFETNDISIKDLSPEQAICELERRIEYLRLDIEKWMRSIDKRIEDEMTPIIKIDTKNATTDYSMLSPLFKGDNKEFSVPEFKKGNEVQTITEEMGIQNEWYEAAKDVTIETLPEFLRHLIEDYSHDYGTICHAISAASIAAAYAVDHSPQGGITGYQAGCVALGFVSRWMLPGNKTGFRILDYDDFLYPQCEENFKVISTDTWKAIQDEAKRKLEDDDINGERTADPKVRKHWESIVNNIVPFGYTTDGGFNTSDNNK